MCGIIGYVARSRHPEVEDNLGLLRHRGPDGEGEARGNVGGAYYWLGHQRLSIIDLEGGAQPFHKGKLVITFNGEIYNYVELAAELTRDHGVRFDSRSDTEVALEAFRAWGSACLHRFNGMWAFAIVDTATGTLFGARDRLGKKPFYYHLAAEGFFFSSEPTPLLPLLPRVRADTATLVAFLLGTRSSPSSTYFDGIKQLPAGHYLELPPRSMLPHIRQYWSPRDVAVAAQPPSFEEASARVKELLDSAVELRLRSDVGFAIAASGGLDSTILLEAVSRIGTRAVPTVSVTFDQEFALDETSFIESLASAYSIKPTYARASSKLTVHDMLEDVADVVAAMGEPSPYTSVPYVSKLYRAAAASGIKVLLEGQGADELFGGYTYFTSLQPMSLLRGWTNTFDYLITLRHRSRLARAAYYRMTTLRPFLTEAAQQHVQLPLLTNHVHDALVDAQETSVLPALLQYSDRLAMACGLEVRLPFLDYRLVEFANSLPDEFKVRGGETKRILRHAFAGQLPQSVLERPKIGFGSPTTGLLRANFRSLVDQFVERGALANSGLFRDGWRRRVRGEFVGALPNSERVLWRFIVADLWLKKFGVEVAA
jgi:asparagine synthase (glutamine-hydrolysing)